MNNNITSAPPSGSAVLPVQHQNLQQTQQPYASHFSGNSVLQFLPLQINGPGTAGNMNVAGANNIPRLVNPTTCNVVTTNASNSSTLTLIPQLSFISSGVGPTPLSTNVGDLSALQQSTSSVSPMISVITSSHNSQPNTTSFLIPSGIQNNSISSGSGTAVPINVILTGTSGNAISAGNNNTGFTAGVAGGPQGDIQSNSVIPASILIRNRQQYQSQGNTKTTTCAAVRSNVDQQPGVLTILNQEIVKQIVVGCTPKNSVITHASSSNSSIVSNSSQTLLKSPSTTSNVAAVKQQHASNKPTTSLTQAPVIPTAAATTTTQVMKKQYQQFNALHSTSNATSISQTPTNNNKLPLSEASKAAAVASSGASLRSIRRESGVFNVDLSSDPRQSIPPPVSTSAMETSNQTNVSVIKTTSLLNPSGSGSKTMVEGANFNQSKTTGAFGSSSDSSGSFKVEIDLTKPVLVQAKLVEKQESLLKARPSQHAIECETSPRSKRSKSLSCAFKEVQHPAGANLVKPKQASLISQYSLTERRHSTASEGKMLKQKSSSPRRKQTLASLSDVSGQEYNIIDLIDYNDEEHELMNEKQPKKDAREEIRNLELHKDGKNMEKQSEYKKELKPPSTQAGNEVKPADDNDANNILKEDASEGTLKTHITTATSTSVENASEVTMNTGKESEQFEETSIKIEIIIDEDQNSTEPRPAACAETEDILSKDTKGDDTQTSVEHTQDSLEKSLYCDEKISLSSTSSTSTSSSRQSLHDDVPTLSNVMHAKSTAITLNQPSTSAAAGIAQTAMVPTTSSEDSLSCALKMLANFNTLTWNQRIGSARGTNMRFQLNEFNLIEINERCSPRSRVHTAYEKPIYERESAPYLSEKKDGLLYLCRRCNCHGPALDFLAPEFCSLDCLKRESRKRRHEEFSTITRKRKNQEISAQPISKKSFRWSTYLPEKFNAIAAPVNLFINPFPTGPNRFQIGMKLEAIDPENCSLFCVCTIVDIQGYRLKLTFDGYEYMYDFWVNADSMDIFPPGWCAKTKRVLQPPKGKTVEEFNWPAYLQECKAIAAQRMLFTHLNASFGTHNPFKIGMHLEAEDLNDTGKLCVASISDVLDNRVRVHFDGWDDCYDYWVDISSPYIHPCGWHVGRQQLIVPPEFENTTFSWTDYIKNHGSGMAATEEMFSTRDPIDFKPNMKLEVVDPRNPSLIRPATVVGRKGHRVKLHLDCWASNYCFWLEDDSADLHPIGWCEATGHDLEPPPGYKMRSSKMVCSTFGCRGIGNAKRLYLNTHTTQDCCPYAPENWRQKGEKPPRLEHEEIVHPVSRAKRDIQQQKLPPQLPPQLQWKQPQPPKHQQPKQQQQQSKQQQLSETQILQHIQFLDNIKTRHVILQEKQQQKQTAQLRAHRSSIATATSQQQSLIKTEHADKPTASALRAHQPVDRASVEGSTSLLLPQIKIAKEFLCDYGPRLQQNYNIWQRNVAFDMQRIKRNPLLWTTKDSCAFVQCVLRNSEATDSFLREDIDGSALLSLQQSDLTEILGLKLGPAVKLYSCILQLRTLAVLKFDVKMSSGPSGK